jgi:hypothetical protein
MNEQEKIKVWVTPEDDRKAALPSLAKKASAVVEVGAEVLAQKVQNFLANFRPLTESSELKDSPFVVDEIELSLAVNASGGIELIGKVEGGAEASMKITLRRRSQRAADEGDRDA